MTDPILPITLENRGGNAAVYFNGGAFAMRTISMSYNTVHNMNYGLSMVAYWAPLTPGAVVATML